MEEDNSLPLDPPIPGRFPATITVKGYKIEARHVIKPGIRSGRYATQEIALEVCKDDSGWANQEEESKKMFIPLPDDYKPHKFLQELGAALGRETPEKGFPKIDSLVHVITQESKKILKDDDLPLGVAPLDRTPHVGRE